VEHLLKTSVVDGFRETALFNTLFRSDVLASEIVFFEGLKQMPLFRNYRNTLS
jgi:hypothetical protein